MSAAIAASCLVFFMIYLHFLGNAAHTDVDGLELNVLALERQLDLLLVLLCLQQSLVRWACAFREINRSCGGRAPPGHAASRTDLEAGRHGGEVVLDRHVCVGVQITAPARISSADQWTAPRWTPSQFSPPK